MATIGNRAYSSIERKQKKKIYQRANKNPVKKSRVIASRNRLSAMRMRGEL